MASNYKRLGDYIQQVDVRNKDLSVDLLLGVSIEKKFIESHANTVGTDFKNYKIVKRGQFAYGPVTSRNGDKISIALLDEADACLISSSYTPFEIIKPDELNAEYLMMLFRNPEFDRFARYNSWGSAREVFSWEDFCDSKLYIPSLEEQQKIVRQYKTITDRIGVLEKINEELEKVATSIYQNEIIDKIDNMPDGWTISTLGECGLDISDGNYSSKYPSFDEFKPEGIPFIRGTDFKGKYISLDNALYITPEKHKELKKGHTKKGDILMTTRGYIGNIAYIPDSLIDANINSQLVRLNGNGVVPRSYLAMVLSSYIVQEEIQTLITGSAQQQLPIKHLNEIHIPIPSRDVLSDFEKKVEPIIEMILFHEHEKVLMNQLRSKLV